MSFPNTMYKPGDEVWFTRLVEMSTLTRRNIVRKSHVRAVRWTEEEVTYELAGFTGTWDCDDLYPTKEAALQAANGVKNKEA